jgi:hypothetical protein
MSFRPRDNCDRSRRVSGTGCGLLNLAVFLIEFDSDHVAGFAILADFTSSRGCNGSGRGRLRNGLACPATLSHNRRSSSVSARWRLGRADASGDKRFIAPSDASGGGNRYDAAGCALI